MTPYTYEQLKDKYTQEKKLHEFHVNQLVEQLNPLKALAEHYIIKEAHEANDRSDVESLKELSKTCFLELDAEIEQIWETRKAELIQQHRDADITHLEWLRGQ